MNRLKRLATGGRPYPKDAERRRLVKIEFAKRDMTVTDLAKALGMNQGYLSDLMNGTRRSPRNEERVATYFGLTAEQLFPRRTFRDLLGMRGEAA